MTLGIQQGKSLICLIVWLLITSTVLPLLCSLLIMTATYYSKTAYMLLALSELSFLKSLIQMDLMTGSLHKMGPILSISSQSNTISYTISNARLKRRETTSRYVSSFLRIDSLGILHKNCIQLIFLHAYIKPLVLCKARL